MKNRWTKEDIDYLIKHYNKIACCEIAQHLKRSVSAIRLKAYYLDITDRVMWPKKNILFLKANYQTMTAQAIADHLKLPVTTVRGCVQRLKLEGKTAWEVNEDHFLEEHYGKLTLAEIMKRLNRSKASVYNRICFIRKRNNNSASNQ